MDHDVDSATREVVAELLARLAQGPPDSVARLYAERVDWAVSWPTGERSTAVPWIRDRRTRGDVAEHFAQLARHHRPGDAGTTIERVLVDGSDAVITGVIRNTVVSTGTSYAARFALHLRVEDGLIVQHHVYEDSLAVHDAWLTRD